MNARPESTGWRDEEISRRHRLYGSDCPATDVDFVVVEFDRLEPVALIEHKVHSAPWNRASAGVVVMERTGDRADLPFFVARYWKRLWAYEVHPINEAARQKLRRPYRLTEREYTRFLYWLRGRKAPAHVLAKLNNVRPPPASL